MELKTRLIEVHILLYVYMNDYSTNKMLVDIYSEIIQKWMTLCVAMVVEMGKIYVPLCCDVHGDRMV